MLGDFGKGAFGLETSCHSLALWPHQLCDLKLCFVQFFFFCKMRTTKRPSLEDCCRNQWKWYLVTFIYSECSISDFLLQPNCKMYTSRKSICILSLLLQDTTYPVKYRVSNWVHWTLFLACHLLIYWLLDITL